MYSSFHTDWQSAFKLDGCTMRLLTTPAKLLVPPIRKYLVFVQQRFSPVRRQNLPYQAQCRFYDIKQLRSETLTNRRDRSNSACKRQPLGRCLKYPRWTSKSRYCIRQPASVSKRLQSSIRSPRFLALLRNPLRWSGPKWCIRTISANVVFMSLPTASPPAKTVSSVQSA